MRRLIQIAFAGWVAFSMGLAQAFALPADGNARGPYEIAAAGSSSAYGAEDADSTATDTSGYEKDEAQSTALSSYLKDRRLPLVGAQVLRDPSTGKRVVVLYGFVATDFGKSDATTKAKRFLKDPAVVVDNRVMVNPEIAAKPQPSRDSQSATAEGSAAGSSRPDDGAEANANPDSMPGIQGYLQQQNQQPQIQQYQAQQSGGAAMLPLVALLGLLSAASGHGSSFSFGSSNQFGPSNQFSGSSPFGMSPYGSPFGYPAAPPGSYSPYGPSGPSPYGGGSGSGFSPYP